MDFGVIKKIRGMLATAFLCHFLFLAPHDSVSNLSQEQSVVVSDVVKNNVQPQVVEPFKYRPSLHQQFYIKCDDVYFARVESFLKTATHQEIKKYLAYLSDTLTLLPRSELIGYDDLYIDNVRLVLIKLFSLFERCFIDVKTNKVIISDDKQQRSTRSKKKLLDYYLEMHAQEALLFYLVCADYSIALINFYLMLPSLTSEQFQEMCSYHDGPLTLIITTKLPLWHETGDEAQSIKNYYQEAYKRVGECMMTGLRTKLEKKS